MFNDKEISKLVRSLRKKNKLTQAELAAKVGVSAPALNRYEKGERGFPINNIGDYARALNVTPEYLLGLEDKHPSIPSFASPVSSASTKIPLFASISCGDLSSIDNDLIGQIEVPERLVKRYGHDNLFAVKTKGDSMNKLVLEGHLAILAKNTEWRNGDAVAVLVNGDDATLKKITKTDSSIILEPSSYNPEHQPIFINCNEVKCDEYVKVIGKFVGSMNFEQ